MVERDDLVATYSVDYVAGVMSLRKPQKESLSRLEKIWNAADIRKGADMADNLARGKELYPLCKDFERAFPSLAFALATGVGKTRLMGAFITWLYAQKGVKNFFIVVVGFFVIEFLVLFFDIDKFFVVGIKLLLGKSVLCKGLAVLKCIVLVITNNGVDIGIAILAGLDQLDLIAIFI